MWFENERTGAMFGIMIPHGGVVILSKYGGGVTSNWRHKVTGGEHSWYFALDFGLRAEDAAEMV